MNIINVPIDRVKNWEGNPRGILKDDFVRLKKQIQKLGVYKPLVAYKDRNSYIVLGGNMRLRALQDLRHRTVELSVIKADTEAKRLEYALSDNDRAGFYQEQELAELVYKNKDEIDIDNFKVDIAESKPLSDLIDSISPSDEIVEDELPELQEKTNIKNGDIFQLGNHRLICADCTIKKNVDRLMNGQKADMVFTDPPFNIDYKYNDYNDNKSADNYYSMLKQSFEYLISDNDNLSFYIMQHHSNFFMQYKMLLELGLTYKNVIIWKTPSQSQPKDSFNHCYQPILFFVKGKPTFIPYAETKTDDYEEMKTLHEGYKGKLHDIWDDIKRIAVGAIVSKEAILKENGCKQHPAQMPIALAARAIKFSSLENHNIVDLFLGSGSTLIACEKTNRKCYGMEIDPIYCQVVVDRWEQLTGKKAKKDK